MLNNNIYCMTNVAADSWQDAITKAGKLLLQDSCIKEEYIKKMIDSVLEYGPYIVIDKGLALAHARPEDGAIRTGLSIITLDPPVCFGSDNDPVKILIALAAANDDDHISVLSVIADFLAEKENTDKISNADGIQLKKIMRSLVK